MISSLIVVKIQSNSDTSFDCGREGPCHVMAQSITAAFPTDRAPMLYWLWVSLLPQCSLHSDQTLWASPLGLHCKSRHSMYSLLESFQSSHPCRSQHLCFSMQLGFLLISHPGAVTALGTTRAAQKGPGPLCLHS